MLFVILQMLFDELCARADAPLLMAAKIPLCSLDASSLYRATESPWKLLYLRLDTPTH